MRAPHYVGLACSLLLLAGCGGAPDSARPSAAGEQRAPAQVSVPVSLSIPSVGVAADVRPIDMVSRTIDVSPLDAEPADAGWYKRSAKLGQEGPTVIAGHVDYRGPAVFGRLDKLTEGAQVSVTGQDGAPRAYVVYRISQVPKASFPTQAVYGPTATPELRLVTCGGDFREDARSYTDNIVAFARLAAP